jgi:hypothetical protein
VVGRADFSVVAECVVVADVELVTDWGGSGEGRVAGISASTVHVARVHPPASP